MKLNVECGFKYRWVITRRGWF